MNKNSERIFNRAIKEEAKILASSNPIEEESTQGYTTKHSDSNFQFSNEKHLVIKTRHGSLPVTSPEGKKTSIER